MNGNALLDVVNRFGNGRVLCVGDIILDRFVSGTVARISPEAPIPVLHSDAVRTAIGGAGNVVNNLRALGAQVFFISLIGDDAEGRELAELLRIHYVVSHLLTDAERPTSLKTRYLSESQQMLRVDRESTVPISASVSATLVATVEKLLPEVDAVILSDYAKGVLTPAVLKTTIEACRKYAVKIYVDPKGGDYDRYAGADVLTPNARELEESSGVPVRSDDSAVTAARCLIGTHGFPAILATRGAHGMSLVTATECEHFKAHPREVYDVSGAGDTVIATFALACAVGASHSEATQLANLTAGMVVEKAGTAVVKSSELIDALGTHTFTFRRKLLTLETATERVARWKANGFKVGFTNGCFDLIHPGHLSLLDQASQACDRLIVGLNSDASVERLKGSKRPIQDEQVRAAVLASFESVDGVLIFSGDTPLPEICALAPDLLVKGADYSEAQVIGADVVRENGGAVILAKLVTGYSTTNTIATIEHGVNAPKITKP